MKMAEVLSMRIVKEYQDRLAKLPEAELLDIGERRKLRIELQERCGLTELEAVNALNGYHVSTYIAKYERRALLDEYGD